MFKRIDDAIRGKLESAAIGYVIRSIESGQYGDKVRAFWLALKGKKSIIGFAVAAIGGALATFPDPSLVTVGGALAVAGTYLFRFGLIAKGSDQSVIFPDEYRSAAVFALSVSTYLIETLTGIAGLMMLSGSVKAQSASLEIILICQAASTACGYFSTLIGPSEAAATSLGNAVAALGSAQESAKARREDLVSEIQNAKRNGQGNGQG